MVILFLADPNSIHDRRWIQSFSEKNIKCIVVPRLAHFQAWQNNSFHGSVSFIVEKPLPDPSVLNPFKEFQGILHLKRLISKYKAQLIHIIYAEPNALWGRFKKFLKVPVIITTHGSDVLKTIPRFHRRKDFLSKVVYDRYLLSFNKANQITCSSTSQRNSLIEMSEDLSKKISIIRVGVDFEYVNNLDYELIEKDIKVDKPYILMPRNMQPIYNHEFTIKAIGLLNEQILEKFTFVFLNSDTQNREYFEKVRNQATGLRAKVVFLPTLEHKQLIALYKEASLVIMNPVSDGSPVTAMEAMLCKVPVILGPISYDKELFNDSVFKLSRWEPNDLASLISDIICCKDGRIKHITERAFQTIVIHANYKQEIEKIINLYKKHVIQE